ncbi:kinase-like protein [Nemania abortiva]|nr:kinase-like protein [Nemania abortiva]
MEQLKTSLKALRRRNASRHWFIPSLSFDLVVTEEAVRQTLVEFEVPVYLQEETVAKVFQHGRRIFATLLLLGYQDYLSYFIESDQIEDAKLPFKTEILVQEVRLPAGKAADFEDRQWEVIAPTFRRGTLNRRLGEGTVLPFLKDERIGEGAFGTVYEVMIDADHQSLDFTFPERVARKEFTIGPNHAKELENLSILNHLKHPNIVELLSSYEHGGKYNLLFPLAKDGNLDQLLATERHSTKFVTNQSILAALASLASALEHVHDFSESKLDLELIGFHHDLRPRNILVSEDRFILADFGLSSLKPKTMNSETPFKNGTDDYLAPECEDWNNGFQTGTVHRSADIWSLGCIIAEVATYMVKGHQGIEEFRKSRQYKVRGWTFQQFHQGPKEPSESVAGWLSELEQSGSTSVRSIVRVIRQALSMDHLERPKAKEMTQRLQLIALRDAVMVVDEVFVSVKEKHPSLDITLEYLRFNAWRQAKDLGESTHGLEENAIPLYEEIQSVLSSLLANLNARLEQGPQAQKLDLSGLSSLNEKLQGFLNTEQERKARDYFLINVLEQGEQPLDSITGESTSGSLSYEIRMRVNIKYIGDLLEKDSVSASASLRIDPGMIGKRVPFGDHYHGWLTDSHGLRQVWIELRKYGKHGTNAAIIRQLCDRAAQTAHLLSQNKPDNFRTLTSSGFFHEPDRTALGIVFEFPGIAAKRGTIEPLDLRQRLMATVDKRASCPDLDDRFKLASAIAGSLFEFHTVGWMHRNLTSSSVVFFPSPTEHLDSEPGSDSPDMRYHSRVIREPFLVGFNRSRPDDPKSYTSGLSSTEARHYHHPEYIKRSWGYQPEYDYYSLGMILLEIGFWLPLSKITEGWDGSYEERRQRLVTRRLPRLRQLMGRDYSEAVRCCLESDFNQGEDTRLNDDDNDYERAGLKEVKLQYSQRVIRRLNKWFTE